MGLVFGNPDTSYFANLARCGSYCYLSLMKLNDGSIFYQHRFTCTPIEGYLAEKVISNSQYIVALVDHSSTQSNQRLSRTVVGSSGSVTSASYYSISRSDFFSRGLSIAS